MKAGNKLGMKLNMRIRKRDLTLLIVTVAILSAIALFAILNWSTLITFIKMLLEKTDLVKDFIRSFGFPGKLVLFLIIVACFFFPVISSLPAQVALGLAYGLFEGSIIVSLAFFTAAQIYYLIRKDMRILSKRKKKKDAKIKEMIANSDVNIHFAMVLSYVFPFIPFIIISGLAYDGLKKYWQYFLYTLFGPVGEVVFTLFVGEKLLNSSPIATFITLIFIIIVVFLSIVFKDKMIEFIFRPKKEGRSENEAK